jgi:hypothetical protein
MLGYDAVSLKWGITSWSLSLPGRDVAPGRYTEKRDCIGYEVVKGFEGTPQINASIIRGEIHLTQVYASAAYPVIKGGDLKGLVVLDDKPWDQYPEMPTLLKLGSAFTHDQLSMAKALIGLFNGLSIQ